MSNREHHNPTSGNTSAGEQIPHSGVGGYEQPVNDFDNTSLQDAVDQGLLETPESPAPLVSPSAETKPSRRRLTVKEKLGLGLAGLGLVGGGAYLATHGGDSDERSPERPVATATGNPGETPTTTPSSEVEPTAEPSDPYAETSWRETLTPDQVILTEKYPTMDTQVAKGFEIITAAANDPGPNLEGITFKYDEALYGGSHYDTDMRSSHEWLDELSSTIGMMNDDFELRGEGQPKFVIDYKVADIAEQVNDRTVIAKVVRTSNIQDFTPKYQDLIHDYLKNVSPTGEETIYWKVSLRYEEGRALLSGSETLDNYTPPAK